MNLSKDVRILLERALRFARKNRYIYLTPEMLLLILLEEESFREAVDLCGGDIDALIKDLKGYLEEYVDRGNGKNPEISEALKESKDVADYQVENSLYRLATGYVDSEGKWHPPNITAIIFWLKNRKPQEWREKRELYEGEEPKQELSPMEQLVQSLAKAGAARAKKKKLEKETAGGKGGEK